MRGRAASWLTLVEAAATLCLGAWLLLFQRPIGWHGQWEWKLGVMAPSGLPLLVGVLAMAVSVSGAWALFRREPPSAPEPPGTTEPRPHGTSPPGPAGPSSSPRGERGCGSGATAGVRYDSAPLAAHGSNRQLLRASRALAFGWQTALVLGSLLWTLAVYAATPAGWFMLHATQLSDVSCEYFGEAYAMDSAADYLRSYGEHQATSGYHVATHPPGAVLFYRGIIVAARATGLARPLRPLAEEIIGLSAVTTASEVRAIPTTRPLDLSDFALPLLAGFLTAALGALCVVPAAACGRIVWGREGAFAAAVLAATLPAVALCFQGLDGPIALLALVALWVALEASRRGAWWWSAACGVVLGIALFVTFGAAAAVVMCAVILLVGGKLPVSDGAPRPNRTRRLRAVAMVGVLVLGIVAVWAPLVALFGLDPVSMLAHGAEAHHKVIAGFRRAYGVWVWLNLVEFGSFAGPALAVLAAAAAPGATRRGGLARALAVAVIGTLVALDLSGTVRAEVGRIWFLLMPPLCVLAAGAVSGEPHDRAGLLGRIPPWLPTVLLQCVAALALAVALHPTARPF